MRELNEDLTSETCRRLAALFQEHFGLDCQSVTAQHQKAMAFNIDLRCLLNSATQRLQDFKMYDSNAAEGELLESKELVENFSFLHSMQVIRNAVLKSICLIHKELKGKEDVGFKDIEMIEHTLVPCGMACSIVDLLSDTNPKMTGNTFSDDSIKLHNEHVDYFLLQILLPYCIPLDKCTRICKNSFTMELPSFSLR